MVNARTWKEFRETGLLFLVNAILHAFGWAIVLNVEENGDVSDAYPARVKFRGFSESASSEAYIRINKFMKESASDLLDEALED